MNRSASATTIGFVAAVLLTVSVASGRTWTNQNGQTLEAVFVRVVGSQVILRRGTKFVRLPFSTLSPSDQEYIRQKTTRSKPRPVDTSDLGASPHTETAPSNQDLTDDSLSRSRVWSDVTGEFQIEAEFISLVEGTVSLKRLDDGRTISVPLARLSESDRNVASRLADKTQRLSAPAPSKIDVAPIEVAANLRIPVVQRGTQLQVVYASHHGPFVAIDDEVFDIRTGQKSGSLPFRKSIVHPPNVVLSPNGRYFAVFQRVDNATTINVTDSSTGQSVQQIIIATEGYPQTIWLDFLDDNRIGWIGRIGGKSSFRHWDLKGGQEAQGFEIAGLPKEAALHPDGKTMAVALMDKLLLFDLEEGEQVGVSQMPMNFHSMTFSPDGTEMAVAYRVQRFEELAIYDQKGQRIFSATVEQGITPWKDTSEIQWLPDGSGWLLNSMYLLDRQTGSILWRLVPFRRANPPTIVLSGDKVLTFSKDGNSLIPLKIPRQQIAQAASELNSDKPAALRPGMKVRLQVHVGSVRYGSPQEMADDLRALFERRLSRNGLVVAEDGPLLLEVRYGEKAGAHTTVVERDLIRRDEKVVGSGTQTEIDCVARLVSEDGRELWSKVTHIGSSRGGSVSSANAESWRNGRVSSVKAGLERDVMPIYVSSDPAGPTVPVVTILEPPRR